MIDGGWWQAASLQVMASDSFTLPYHLVILSSVPSHQSPIPFVPPTSSATESSLAILFDLLSTPVYNGPGYYSNLPPGLFTA
jgi:hypothetical protein